MMLQYGVITRSNRF